MKEESKYKVYKITCLENGKMYFGITKMSIAARMKKHRYFASSGSNFLISRAIKKYGWDSFSVEVVEQDLSMEEACQLEIRLISENRTCYENGYNMAKGGQTGISLRPETKVRKSIAGKIAWLSSEKMQMSVKDPERNKKIGLHSKKLHNKKEYRDEFLARHSRMIDLSRGKECRERAKKTFIDNGHSTNLTCSNGMEFCSIADAARWVSSEIGGDARSKCSNIRAAMSGRRKSAYGYHWKQHETNS